LSLSPIPPPAFDAHVRKGANLFTNSAVVLDARTGKYLWHFQARPNDNHDYGVSPPGVLVSVGGKSYLVQASKDGFVYMIDRTSHRLAWKTPVTTILNHTADATPTGVRICPGAKGGVEYNSPAYDPGAGLLVVGSVDWCYILSKVPYPPYSPGNPYVGGLMTRGDPNGTGWVTALDATSGKVRWRFPTPAPVVGAITPTAGGITFAGDASGALYMFRTSDGTLLRTIQTGGAIAGGIITYQIRGQQYLAVGSGNVSRSSWSGATGIPTMIVYRLAAAISAGADPASLTPDAAHGSTVYATACAACHGAQGQGGEGTPLTGISARYSQAQVVAYIVNPKPRMPKLYPGSLNAQDVADVAAHVRTFPQQ
jgi:outer membrane protein assembly factor BamB